MSNANLATQNSGKPFDHETNLQMQASHLLESLNNSNVIGNEFNRQEAESKIEKDFQENDKLLNT